MDIAAKYYFFVTTSKKKGAFSKLNDVARFLRMLGLEAMV